MDSIPKRFPHRWLILSLAGFGLLLGLLAEGMLAFSPGLSVVYFLAGGVGLAFAGRLAFGPRDGFWAGSNARLRAWEPAFLVLLLLLAALPRLKALADRPAGVGGYEAEMVGQLGGLKADKQHWIIYMQDGDVNWPSLYFYEQIFAQDVLGPGPVSARLPAALWGLLAVLAFYFAARALLSPEAAAGASLMLAGSVYHLTISRSSFPSTIVSFAPVASVAFLVAALRRRSKAWAALAGAAAALGLYGYFPGRAVPGFFIAYLGFCAWTLATDERPTGGQWKAFLLACFLVSAPQLYVAVFHPHIYWDYFVSANPSQGQGLLSYAHTFWDNLGPYVRVFHLHGDPDPGLSPPFRPMLDFVQGWLFPLGLFAALCFFWRPANAFIVGLLAVGLLPAIMGGRGYAHPTTRRMVLAWPAVFLACGLALELFRRGLNPQGSRRRDAWLAAAFVALGAWSYAANVKVYFEDYYSDPNTLNHIDYDHYRIYKDHQEVPGFEVAASPLYMDQEWGFYFPNAPDQRLYEPEDVLRLPDDKGTDAYIDPLYAWSLPYLKAAIPELRVDQEPTPGGPGTDRPKDPFEPRWLFVRAVVPPGALARARGMELDGRRCDVSDPGFGQAHAGRALELRALWVAQRQEFQGSLRLDWPGFRASLDGKPLPLGRTVLIAGGPHELELRGRVPGSAQGPLPLSVVQGGTGSTPILYPVRWPYGLLATFYEGLPDWATAPIFSRRLGASVYRFHDTGETTQPFSVRLEGLLRAPQAGVYTFVGTPWSQLRILLDGRRIFDDLPGEPPLALPVALDPRRPGRLQVFYKGYGGGAEQRAVELEWTRRGDPEPRVLEPQDVTTPPWTPWRPLPGGKTRS